MTTHARKPEKQELLNDLMRRREVLEVALVRAINYPNPATAEQVKQYLPTATREIRVLIDGLTATPCGMAPLDIPLFDNRIVQGLVGEVLDASQHGATHRTPRKDTTMTSTTDLRAEGLRDWARGMLPLEAAVEILVRALGGRLLAGLWIRNREDHQLYVDDGRVWFDPELAALESGHLSGGERRALAIATSLASEDHPVDLGDAITGLDPETVRVVLEALAHAGGVTLAEGADHG